MIGDANPTQDRRITRHCNHTLCTTGKKYYDNKRDARATLQYLRDYNRVSDCFTARGARPRMQIDFHARSAPSPMPNRSADRETPPWRPAARRSKTRSSSMLHGTTCCARVGASGSAPSIRVTKR